jgi:ABC-type dipeptide/oligopeptide/nickel transport system permease subunit
MVIWAAGLAVIGAWDFFFLNAPAFLLVRRAAVNTLAGALLVVLLSLVLGWGAGVLVHFLETRRRIAAFPVVFLLNVVRSVPQILGALAGYVVLTLLIKRELLLSPPLQLSWMSLVLSLFLFLEIVDLVRGRIAHFAGSDFVPAMLCSGIPESRIINRDILWKNSRAHILQKMVSIFGGAVFLQCSIDFIVSVGLSTEVSLSNFPVTLGSLLAKLDSKQDILAVGDALANVSALSGLAFEHLQGVSVATIIVFSLFCISRISQGLIREYRL